MANKKTVLRISGMTCAHCEKRVADALGKLPGVKSAEASFPKHRAEVEYDAERVTEEAIKAAVEIEGYKVIQRGHPVGKVAPVFLIVIALYFIVKYTVGFDFINMIPNIDSTVSLAALFVTGLLTSVHCIAMCGGINLSQSVGTAQNTSGRLKKPLLYNLGRVISYTVIGGIVGGIGSVLFVSTALKGVIMLIAAIFMILMSLSMLGWLPWWLAPRLPAKLSVKAHKAGAGRGPLVVGLLNGLLPCGPLQAMQLYALSTGSAFQGALSMLLFSLGTVPLMLGTGLIFSALKGKFTRGITRTSAALVLLIAFVMLANAGALFGLNLGSGDSGQQAQAAAETTPGASLAASVETVQTAGYAVAKMEGGVQPVEASLESSKYPAILVQKGVPVKFNIKADGSVLNGCNGTVEIPDFNIEKKLQVGDNVIEFTPDKGGIIAYTCWMGMISGKISVVDKLPDADTAKPAAAASASADAPAATGTSSALGGAAISKSCCATGTAVKFANGKIPTDEIALAKITNGKQELTVKVNDAGYSPAVLVAQKGVPLKIKFDPEKLNACDGIVVFPEYGGSLDLSKADERETPYLTPKADFTFQCGMGMLHGYVKVVDDINKIDSNAIKTEVSKYKPQSGGRCCG